MKTRESGMPGEAMWESFFSPTATLEMLGLTPECMDTVEFGCGYGTFTIPAAKLISGTVFSLDIEPDMIAATDARASREGLGNVQTITRDFAADGSGLADASVDYAMLFNILHCEWPRELLAESYRVLRPGGRLGVLHWRSDIPTPRGPSLDIRPTPEQCIAWAESVGFVCSAEGIVLIPPYHFGISFSKRERAQGAR